MRESGVRILVDFKSLKPFVKLFGVISIINQPHRENVVREAKE
jgi:hypothetical protein